MEKSMNCIAYNGRYLMMGFASNKAVADEAFIVPRRLAMANVKLCGVVLAYATPEMSQLVKGAMGWNFAPEELGRTIMSKIVDLVIDREVHPVIGAEVGFDDVPAAIEALANRETTGRTIITIG